MYTDYFDLNVSVVNGAEKGYIITLSYTGHLDSERNERFVDIV
jgi:hypothetical protein